LWVILLAGIYSSAFQHPDPNPALDGDPCCGHPDTWGDVLAGGIYFAATLSVALGLLAAAVTLVPALREALEGRFDAHHALWVGAILARVDFLDEQIDRISDAAKFHDVAAEVPPDATLMRPRGSAKRTDELEGKVLRDLAGAYDHPRTGGR
jgi:hypothetical protein